MKLESLLVTKYGIKIWLMAFPNSEYKWYRHNMMRFVVFYLFTFQMLLRQCIQSTSELLTGYTDEEEAQATIEVMSLDSSSILLSLPENVRDVTERDKGYTL